MNKPILMTRLKNEMKKINNNLDFKLKNIDINGSKRGCYGFIRDNDTGVIVYVNTEEPCMANLHYMYRLADDYKDYTGYINHWSNTIEELCRDIAYLLKNPTNEPGITKNTRYLDAHPEIANL